MKKQELEKLRTEASSLLEHTIIVAKHGDIANGKVYKFVDMASIGMSDSRGEMRYDAYGKLVPIEDDTEYKIFSLWAIVHAINERLPIIML